FSRFGSGRQMCMTEAMGVLLQPREQGIDLLGREIFVVFAPDHHRRGAAARGQALDLFEREASVRRGFARLDAEALLEMPEEALGTAQPARNAVAHVKLVAADGRQVVKTVKGRHL